MRRFIINLLIKSDEVIVDRHRQAFDKFNADIDRDLRIDLTRKINEWRHYADIKAINYQRVENGTWRTESK